MTREGKHRVLSGMITCEISSVLGDGPFSHRSWLAGWLAGWLGSVFFLRLEHMEKRSAKVFS